MSAFFLYSQGNRAQVKIDSPEASFGDVVSQTESVMVAVIRSCPLRMRRWDDCCVNYVFNVIVFGDFGVACCCVVHVRDGQIVSVVWKHVAIQRDSIVTTIPPR
jgi:hypothetical protein